MKHIYIILILSTILISCKKDRVFTSENIQLIPKPAELKLKKGSFEFDKNTKFFINNDEQLQALEILASKFKTVANWNLEAVKKAPSSNYIQFVLNNNLEKEAYKLIVNNDIIKIEASNFSGFVYAVETIRQLLPAEIESDKAVKNITWQIPNVTIKDAPRFKWRGLMLDVSRHFFEKEYVLKTIDRLAYLKMNTLHFHLVDDQGWRIEIKKYPKLTEVGAWRVDQEDKPWNGRYTTKLNEKATYGGFYTQEDIKEIVAYAKSRGVTVVPEIEMPAHVTSAIAAYPEFSCLEKPVTVPSGGLWPITDIYCAGKDTTFDFLQDVLTEVMDLFPSKYIHVGGDEATKTNWKTCKHCQKRMKAEGLQNVEELQSYFIKRMERFISSKGRILIGWDEILEGGLAPGATVMSWRGVKGGLEASKQGHDVVMTPGSHCYFDHYQGPMDTEPLAWGGYTPVSKVYQFNPVVESMSKEQAKHVLGGQANLWSESISTTSKSEYMIFPRLIALSEVLWSSKANRSWDEFIPRLKSMFTRYDYQGINYAKSSYTINTKAQVNNTTNVISVALKNEFPKSDIRYVLNNLSLNNEAISYKKPIELKETTTIKASIFKDDKPIGKVFEKTFKYHKAVGKKVTYLSKYSDNYKGVGTNNMTNIIRGSKNFHDGQWQAWIGNDMEVIIDMETPTEISKVSIGSMDHQVPGIYYPTQVKVLLSSDGKTFKKAGVIDRPLIVSSNIEIKDFIINFKSKKATHIKVIAKSVKKTPNGGGAWLFVDEIVVE